MRATRLFHILSVSLILAFLFVAAGPAQAASSPVATQTASLVQGGELLWNTFLGASGSDGARGVAIDPDGNVYVVGMSENTWGDPVREFTAGSEDAFVAKMDSSGALLWNTFLGGSEFDWALGIAVDGAGKVRVAGCSGADWGEAVNPFAGAAENANVFAAGLDASGSLVWNTFLGRSDYVCGGPFAGVDIALDASGNSYVTGQSSATWGSPLEPFPGNRDAFVAKLDDSGVLSWNTFLGSGPSNGSCDIALDGTGNIYIAGDAFVSKLDGSGGLIWTTHLGSDGDSGASIALDAQGNAYVLGQSRTTWGTPVRPFEGDSDAFVAKLDGSGALLWNTFLGSSTWNYPGRIALDAHANAYVVGSSGAPWGTPVRPFTGCDSDRCWDAFVACVDNTGKLIWNTFLGGTQFDAGPGMAIDADGDVYVVGESQSTWGSPIQPFNPDGPYPADAFVAKLRAGGPLYVKQDATGSNNGTSWTDAYTSLQSAMGAAGSGDQIWVAEGTYWPTDDTNRTVSFGLKDGVAIYGGFTGAPYTEGDFSQRDPAANLTVLSGDIGVTDDASDNSYHVVVGSGVSSTAVLDGFTITGGNANAPSPDPNGYDRGGGMYNDGGSPTLTNLIFSVNAAVYGAAIYNTSSDATLTDVTFSANTAAGWGGGMSNANGSSPQLANVAFSDNIAAFGGGMYNDNSSPTLTDVTFTGNTVGGQGGGMFNGSSNPTMTNVTFAGNTTTGEGPNSGGAGMYNYSSSPTLNHVIFSGNTAAEMGGGMFNDGHGLDNQGSNPTLTDVTFSNNTANGEGAFSGGGGMYNDTSSPALTNVTFNSNTAKSGGGMDNDRSSNVTLTNVTFSGNTAGIDGGGMANHGSSSPTLTKVTFSGNTTLLGGGMANDGGNPQLTDVTFTGNTADVAGGMYNADTGGTLTNVTFSNNAATGLDPHFGGGGLLNDHSSPTLVNVTFSGNTAAVVGGGMYNWTGSPTLTNVTISGNSAQQGGGMHNYEGSRPTIYNSIFWGNGAQEITNADTSAPTIRRSIVAGGCPAGSACTNVLDADPKLGPLQNNGGYTKTRALLAGSAAIDKGYNATCATTDQRGYARPQDGNGDGTLICDLGAYEAPATAQLQSIAAQDGWVLESGENTNTGGSFNADGPTFIVGDDVSRRQYRSIVSFKTGGLPDNAVIVSVKLKLTRQSVVPAGSNPFNALQGLMIDARKGYLGTLPALQSADFKASGVTAAGPFKPAAVGGVYTIKLPAALYASINLLSSNSGLTQLRLRFKLDDDNDAAADYIKFFSGNHPTVTYRPLLVIQYYAP